MIKNALRDEGKNCAPFWKDVSGGKLNLSQAREHNENMSLSLPRIVTLIEGMEARKEKGFRVSPQTAPLIIEALRLYARAPVGEPASYKVERWDWRGDRVQETVATATLVMIGHAAFHAAVEQYPGASLTLRQGARVILKSPE
jgi:hypothetical protein